MLVFVVTASGGLFDVVRTNVTWLTAVMLLVMATSSVLGQGKIARSELLEAATPGREEPRLWRRPSRGFHVEGDSLARTPVGWSRRIDLGRSCFIRILAG